VFFCLVFIVVNGLLEKTSFYCMNLGVGWAGWGVGGLDN